MNKNKEKKTKFFIPIIVGVIIVGAFLLNNPIGLVFLFDITALSAYIIMTVSIALSFAAMQMASIQFMTFIQGETPTELIGKVMSLIVILPFVASALGSLIYGVLFEQFESLPWVVIFATVLISIMIAVYSYKHLKNVVPASELQARYFDTGCRSTLEVD